MNEMSVSTVRILTTCRGRVRPGDQIWLAEDGFEKEGKRLRKERILIREGLLSKTTISRRVKKSKAKSL